MVFPKRRGLDKVFLPVRGAAAMSTTTNGHNKSLNTLCATITAEAAILIIDDSFAVRQALSDIFSHFQADIIVYTAANGHEGVQIIQQHQMRIVLVLLDMNMPVMNGEQTYEKLQQIAPQTRVIVSSSLSQDEARLRFGERELPTYLQKPYNVTTLFNAVQTELAMG
jgi:two-component system cell cycle sensor histidine kinase/response regulator CckA